MQTNVINYRALVANSIAKATLSEDAIICKFFTADRYFSSISQIGKLDSKLYEY